MIYMSFEASHGYIVRKTFEVGCNRLALEAVKQLGKSTPNSP